jgi:hypothetical protein
MFARLVEWLQSDSPLLARRTEAQARVWIGAINSIRIVGGVGIEAEEFVVWAAEP